MRRSLLLSTAIGLPTSASRERTECQNRRTAASYVLGMHGSLAVAALIGLSACDFGARRCPDVSPSRLTALPPRLSQTGLYVDIASKQIAPRARAYTPRYELWSDGAVKRRWLLLPSGTAIDSRDRDRWVFPLGTALFKEFRRDGVRVETRLLKKISGDAWAAMAYVWRGNDAWAAPSGVERAGGTPHDVPAAGDCAACHGGARGQVLGYAAVQLEPATPPGNVLERAALGYLHANCGHCHNDKPQLNACYAPPRGLDLALRAGDEHVADTAAYRTIRGREHELLTRVRSRNLWSAWAMPPLASDVVDAQGASKLAAWLDTL